MAENDSIQKYITQFIQENQKIYTRDAITEKLIEAGYSANDIDEAYEALGIGWGGLDKPKHEAMAAVGDWRSAKADWRGFLIFFPGIPILVYALFRKAQFFTLTYPYAIVFLMGTFLPMVVKNTNPGFAKGMIYGFRTSIVLFLILPIVAIALLWGYCMVTDYKFP